jgi:transposase
VLREQFVILHGRLLAIVRDDEVCRRLMTIPGVGPVVALTYRATVDVPARFQNSKAVGAVFGLTPSKYQSGEINRSGRISRCGDEMMRMMLYEAAQVSAFLEMVLAQGLGDEDRQAPRDEEGDRGAGASVGRDHAPHMG